MQRGRETDASFTVEAAGQAVTIACQGAWVTACIAAVDGPLRKLTTPGRRQAVFDLAGVSAFDTAGAWLVHRTCRALERSHVAVEVRGLPPERQALLDEVAAHDGPFAGERAYRPFAIHLLERIGAGIVDFGDAAKALLGMLGVTMVGLWKIALRPDHLRWNSFVTNVERAGLTAVPIVILINFLVGAVIAYQGAVQLRAFGAEVLTVNLVSILLLREISILLTAIIVAGRSGSAYAAEIGAMKLHQEIDAMRTLALDPVQILVLPRILALVVALPLLNLVGDIAGLIGGGVASWVFLDMTPDAYLARLKDATNIDNFWVGMIKAPVFGYLIAMIGCHEGFRVEGSAESVGRHTTQSVVEAIFVVIVVDAVFSIFFVQVGL